MLPTPVFWPGKFHGLYSPWGCEESDMIERTCHQQSNWFPAHLEGSTSHVCWLWGYLCWGTWWMCQGLQKSQDKHYAVLKHQYSLRIWENILYQNKDILCMYTCVCVCVCTHTRSCPTLCDPMNWSQPCSSTHGISQAKILDWVASSSSRGSSQPRDQIHVFCICCFGQRVLYHWATWEAPDLIYKY